jgi:hypothetical protein
MLHERNLAIYFFTTGELWYKKNEKNFIDMSEVSGHSHSGIVPNYSIKCIAIDCNCSDNSYPLFERWDFVGGSKQGHGYDDNTPLNIALLMLYKKMMDLRDSSGDTDDAVLVKPDTTVKINANIDQSRREHTAKLLNNLYSQVLEQLAVYKHGREHDIPSGSSNFRYSYVTPQDFETYPLVQYETKLKVFFYHVDWLKTESPEKFIPGIPEGLTDVQLATTLPTLYWKTELQKQKPEGMRSNNIELIYPISPTGDQKICKRTYVPIKEKSEKMVNAEKRRMQSDKEYKEKLAAERAAAAAAAAAAAEKEKERIAAAAAAEKEKERISAAAAAAAAAAAEAKEKSWLNRLFMIYEKIRKETPMGVMGGKSKRVKRVKRSKRSKGKRSSTKRRK